MILALGARGPGFKSRLSPLFGPRRFTYSRLKKRHSSIYIFPVSRVLTFTFKNICAQQASFEKYVYKRCNFSKMYLICHLYLVLTRKILKTWNHRLRLVSGFPLIQIWSWKKIRGHTDLNHGPIGLQPIALPLSYIPTVEGQCVVWAPDTARGPLSVEAGIFTRWSLTWPHVWAALVARPVSVEFISTEWWWNLYIIFISQMHHTKV